MAVLGFYHKSLAARVIMLYPKTTTSFFIMPKEAEKTKQQEAPAAVILDMTGSPELIRILKGDPIMLLSYILNESPRIVRELVNDTVCLYYYDESGIYKLLSIPIFDTFVQTFLKRHGLTTFWKSERLNALHRALNSTLIIPTVRMNDYDNLLFLNNGVLNIDDRRFVPHSPDFYSTVKSRVDYKPSDTDASTFLAVLSGMFAADNGQDLTPDDKLTIQNLIKLGGYLLYPKCPMKRMFMLLGEGANGKSLLMAAYNMMFDPQVVSGLDFSLLSEQDKHARTTLVGTRINMVTEQKNNAAGREVNAEEIKKIIDGDPILINPKFGRGFYIKPQIKLIMAANNIPYFSDKTYSVPRRIISFTFPNRYVTDQEYRLAYKPQERRIFPRRSEIEILAAFEREQSAILNLFLHGLDELRRDNWVMEESENSLATRREFVNSSDSLRVYLEDNWELDDYGVTPTVDIRNDYAAWYRENVSTGNLNVSSVTLGKRITEIFRVQSSVVWRDGRSLRGYPIKLRHVAPPLQDEKGNQFNF